MKPGYEPRTLAGKIAWVTEEAGETLAAIGKAGRHGLDSVNPEKPPAEQETNGDWILREMRDLEAALKLLRPALCAKMNEIDGGKRT